MIQGLGLRRSQRRASSIEPLLLQHGCQSHLDLKWRKFLVFFPLSAGMSYFLEQAWSAIESLFQLFFKHPVDFF